MSLIRTLWQYALSPRLYKLYQVSWTGQVERFVNKRYEAQGLERWSDQVVFSFVTAWSFSIYAIPLIVIVLYRRGSPLADAYTISQLMTGAGLILVTSLMARGYSRTKNPAYVKFMKVLDDAKSHYNSETKEELGKYDFDFWAWPIDFEASSVGTANLASRNRTLSPRRNDSILAVPCKILSYCVAHTLALKLIYPGSISVINWVMRGMLLQGRADLVKIGAERFKLLTSDNNEIDAIFLDRRYKNTNGAYLVITCEGNCGFYEVGIISTPIKIGYSVLGWNHPGFGGSTGAPYPAQEENGIDCVMKFAIHKLGFAENKIILNGWSIGGYTSSWAAMNYPGIHSLLLDATFDDILPLALNTMPSSIESVVRNVIRNHFNLNVAEQLNKYDGRVLIVRRTDDEMICVPEKTLAGNRANKLLEKLLLRRYPQLFANSTSSFLLLSKLLSAPITAGKRVVVDDVEVDQKLCREIIANDILVNDSTVRYPSTLGRDCDLKTRQQLVLYLATMYMVDQNSQHCTPLTTELFLPGWNPMSTLTS